MKLLVQGDDYGFTKAVTYGILDAIDNGVLTCTGIFTNMLIAPWAVEQFREKESRRICLGIDFNIVSGPPAADPKAIPNLLDERGEFMRSGVRMKDPWFQTEAGRREMFPYEEVYRECRAQYDRFVALVGQKPGYLNVHSLLHEHYSEAISQISSEEKVPCSIALQEQYGFSSLLDFTDISAHQRKKFDPIEQLNKTPLESFLNHADYFLQKEYVIFQLHPGFVDGDLMDATTLSLERIRDHQAFTSPIFKKWVEENEVELISYYDLY